MAQRSSQRRWFISVEVCKYIEMALKIRYILKQVMKSHGIFIHSFFVFTHREYLLNKQVTELDA